MAGNKAEKTRLCGASTPVRKTDNKQGQSRTMLEVLALWEKTDQDTGGGFES